MEIAVKALSPGVNDPGTAVLCLQSLVDLLALRLENFPQIEMKDKDGNLMIITRERTFDELFEECLLPIWDYGKNDRLVQKEMHHILKELNDKKDIPIISSLIETVRYQLKISTKHE